MLRKADGLFVLLAALHQIVRSTVTTLMIGTVGLVARPAGVSEPIESLAASEEGVVVVTRAGISVMDRTGMRVRTLGSIESRPERRRMMNVDGSGAAPGLPADLDWARRYDIEEIDDADDPRLADEGAPGQGETEDATARIRKHVLTMAATDVSVAAAGSNAWIGRQDGLWQVDLRSGSTRRAVRRDTGHAAIQQIASTADGRIVAFAERYNLYRSSDSGQTFEAVAAVDAPPRAMTATDGGAIVFIDGASGTVRVVPPGRDDNVTTLSVDGAMALVSCGTAALIMRSDTLLAIRWSASSNRPVIETRGAVPPGTRRLACESDQRLWASSDEDLFSSTDKGWSWSRRGDLPPGSTIGIAVGGSTIWIASTSGLWMANEIPPVARVQRSAPHSSGPWGFGGPSIARLSLESHRWWSALLPRVDLVAAAARRGGRRDVRGVILFTFTFEPKRARETPIGASLARRESGSEGPRIGLGGLTGAGYRDAIANEEADALIRIMEEPP